MPPWLSSSPTVVWAACTVALLLIISRQPSAVLHPPLLFEDGKVWYQNAYQFGPFRPLMWPYFGYLETFQRLVAGAALILPLTLVPLFFALVTLVVQVLPVAFLASDRLAPLIPRRSVRLVVALGCLVVPTDADIGTYMTSTEWYLAVLAVLVVLAPRSTRPWWRTFDMVAVTLSGLSGPFCIFLAPAAVLLALVRRSRGQAVLGALVLLTAGLQAGILAANLLAQRADLLAPVHVSLLLGVEMVATRMLTVPILGTPLGYYAIQLVGPFGAVAVVAIALVMLAIALAQGSLEMRLLIAVGLITLVVTMGLERRLWVTMLVSIGSSRYWFFPILTWLTILAVVAFRARTRRLAPLAVILLSLALLVGLPSAWEYPAMHNADFQRAAAAFARALPGQSVRFNEPLGWTFVLTKR